ncbi:MAG: site-specific integrase [Planctomycetaceae bacterium]|nr:site-specific integrase [Planctomycetaceae bacterium]
MAWKRQNPEPKKRLNKGAWEVYWYWNRQKYSYSPGLPPEQEEAANYILHVIAVELLKESPDFPEEMTDAPGIIRYLHDRFGTQKPDELTGDWIEGYKPTLTSGVGKGWRAHTLRYLEMLRDFSGDITSVTNNQAQEFLNGIIERGRKPGTHNKALAACSKFYKWAVRTKRAKRNPFEGIKQLKEVVDHDIVYCTQKERDAIIELAKGSGWTDWLSIPIAFYSGMRREEIARLKWEDVKFDVGLIKITKTKIGRSRETPLHDALEKLLLEVPEDRREGFVVLMDHRASEGDFDVQRADRMIAFIQYLRATMKRKNPKFPIAHIGWNPFRHTFASLLVQSGVELDTVSHWMGNTPEVCRRHYAQFIPRDRRDDRINRI